MVVFHVGTHVKQAEVPCQTMPFNYKHACMLLSGVPKSENPQW